MEKQTRQLPQDLKKAISLIAPGTDLRAGLDHLVVGKMGGLIFVGKSEEILPITDGGFFLDVPYSPNYLYELGKMDGAIILSADSSRIMYANCQLTPRYDIETSETGTRHRTAERVAKMTSGVVISISQRRNQITLYHREHSYQMKDISLLVNLAAQCQQALQTARLNFDEALKIFFQANGEGRSNCQAEIDYCLFRGQHLLELYDLMEIYLLELGSEGHLFTQAISDLLNDVETQMNDLKKLLRTQELKML
jgi:diadenylate cyclase